MGWGQTGPSLSPNCWLNHKWFIILSSLVSDWLNCVDSDTIQGKEMKGKVCWGQMASRKYFHPWLQKREWFERSELGLPLGELSCFQMFLWEGIMQVPLPPPFAPDECAADSLRLAAKREKKPQFLIIAHLPSQPSIHIPLNFQLHKGSKCPYKMNYF